MKKSLSLFCTITFCLGFSQVGINTINPQGAFHVDGAKDNPSTGVPTTTQINDFIVTSAGNVGIGVIAPQKKIDIDANNASLRIRNLIEQIPEDHDFLTINTTNSDVVATRYAYTTSITVQPGLSGTAVIPATINIPNGFVMIKSSNSCGVNMISNFIYSSISLGYATSIASDKMGVATIGPIAAGGGGSGVWTIKFPNITTCNTGNSTQFDYTLSKPNNNSYLIVNNGNIAQTYTVTIFRL